MHNEGVAHSGEYKISICKAGFAEAKTQKNIGVIIYNVPAQLLALRKNLCKFKNCDKNVKL